MVRGKTEMKRIENTSSRRVMFTKRRNGLLKKAYELSVLCGAEVGLVVFSPRGKLHEFASPSMQKVLERYHGTNDVTQEHDNEDLNRKIANMKERIRILESTQRNMAGEDLATMTELNELEVRVDRALHSIRARKAEILVAQVEQLKTQEEGKTKDCCSKEKDKAKLTAVPLAGNHMQTRRTKLKHISQGKEIEISARRKKVNG